MKKQKENSHEGITWSEMGKQNVQAEKVYKGQITTINTDFFVNFFWCKFDLYSDVTGYETYHDNKFQVTSPSLLSPTTSQSNSLCQVQFPKQYQWNAGRPIVSKCQ